jgi:hypothetical protein
MNLIKPTAQNFSIRLLKSFINNLNHNSLGYLTLLIALYIFTPLPLQLNTWPVIRQRLTVLLELPLKAIDSAIATVGGKSS